MKKAFVIGINLILFVLIQIGFGITIYGMGYATDNAAPHDEWKIFIGFFIGHLLLNMLLLYLFKSIRLDFILISNMEVVILYGILFWAYYR